MSVRSLSNSTRQRHGIDPEYRALIGPKLDPLLGNVGVLRLTTHGTLQRFLCFQANIVGARVLLVLERIQDGSEKTEPERQKLFCMFSSRADHIKAEEPRTGFTSYCSLSFVLIKFRHRKGL